MTRSKKALSRRLDRLDSSTLLSDESVEAWASRQIEQAASEGAIDFSHTVIGSDGEVIEEPDRTGQVLVAESDKSSGCTLWIGRTAIPEWIDVDTDLPVNP